MYEGRPINARKWSTRATPRSKSIRATGRSSRSRKPIDLPALTANLSYQFEFADPIFRLGNDYSKGIIVATGYVGQKTPNSLVTCLTDGHPGVSGGGVLNAEGELVGIPDRPDAGRLPLLVHSSVAGGDVPPVKVRDRHSLSRSRIVDSKPRSVGS